MNPSLDVYEMTDQPETCRKCGSRTDFIQLNSKQQKHTCPECSYQYIVEEAR